MIVATTELGIFREFRLRLSNDASDTNTIEYSDSESLASAL